MGCHKPADAVLHSKLLNRYKDTETVGKKEVIRVDCPDDTENLMEEPMTMKGGGDIDHAVVNASVQGRPGLSTILVSDNMITHVGDNEELKQHIGGRTRVIDAGGNSVCPGFTDSHLHLTVAMEKNQGCDLEPVQKTDEFREKLTAYAHEMDEAEVLYAYGLHYFDPPIIPAETARTFLDSIVGDKPLVVFAHDLHTAWANTKALDTAGLLHVMPDYPPLIEELGLQDKIVLGPDNMPGGELREPEVYYFVSGPLQDKYPLPLEDQLENLRQACQQLADLGFTCVHNMGLAQPSEEIAFFILLLELEQRGELPIRVNTSFSSVADENMLLDVYQAYLIRKALRQAKKEEMTPGELHDYLVQRLSESGTARHRTLKKVHSSPAASAGDRAEEVVEAMTLFNDSVVSRYVDPHRERDNPHNDGELPGQLRSGFKVRCDTVKIFMDGIIEKGTAFRLDQDPEEGIPEFTQEELDVLVEFADRLGMQVAAHCIGNGSVRSVLDAVSKARENNSQTDRTRGHRIRHRIEHIELCHPEDIPRFGVEDVTASMQPLHERAPVTMWHKLVPKEQWDTAFAWKDITEDGGLLVFGSDWPIVPCDVRKAVRHACTRKEWTPESRNQGISFDQALDAYTVNAPVTDYSQSIRGRLAPGMLADLVILDSDIRELEKEDGGNPGIIMTICDGKITHDATSG